MNTVFTETFIRCCPSCGPVWRDCHPQAVGNGVSMVPGRHQIRLDIIQDIQLCIHTSLLRAVCAFCKLVSFICVDQKFLTYKKVSLVLNKQQNIYNGYFRDNILYAALHLEPVQLLSTANIHTIYTTHKIVHFNIFFCMHCVSRNKCQLCFHYIL